MEKFFYIGRKIDRIKISLDRDTYDTDHQFGVALTCGVNNLSYTIEKDVNDTPVSFRDEKLWVVRVQIFWWTARVSVITATRTPYYRFAE